MSIYSVNILSVCLSVILQKALLLMDVVILVHIMSTLGFLYYPSNLFPDHWKPSPKYLQCLKNLFQVSVLALAYGILNLQGLLTFYSTYISIKNTFDSKVFTCSLLKEYFSLWLLKYTAVKNCSLFAPRKENVNVFDIRIFYFCHLLSRYCRYEYTGASKWNINEFLW